MAGHGVQAFEELCVYVRVVPVLLAGGIVGDVAELVVEVVGVSDAVFMISAVPDCSC